MKPRLGHELIVAFMFPGSLYSKMIAYSSLVSLTYY